MPRWPLQYPSPDLVIDRLNTRPPGRSRVTTRERVRWLLKYRSWWDGLYPELLPAPERAPVLLRLAAHAKLHGLYARTTYERDAAHSLVGLIVLARACRKFKIRP